MQNSINVSVPKVSLRDQHWKQQKLYKLVKIVITTNINDIAAVYAGGDDDGGDGNKQKAEDDSSAALADCDDNNVEQAGFDCIAIAASEIETAEEPPTEEGSVTVCKEVNDPNQEVVPSDFRFTLIGGGSNVQSQGFPPPECLNSPTSIVGDYSVTEDRVGSDAPPLT